MMPDHVHLLVEAEIVTSDLVSFVAKWKQATGYLFRQELPQRLWQRRFYDHVLLQAKDSDAVAWYIWMNPVRKGIVSEPQQYPFSGSFTVEWPKVCAPSTPWLPPWKASAGMR
jgi:putative transposase